MTDTTNHAEVIREALRYARQNCEVPHCGSPELGGGGLCDSCTKGLDAFMALGALTRELEDARASEQLAKGLLEGPAGALVREGHLKTTIAAQTERIAKLEEENAKTREEANDLKDGYLPQLREGVEWWIEENERLQTERDEARAATATLKEALEAQKAKRRLWFDKANQLRGLLVEAESGLRWIDNRSQSIYGVTVAELGEKARAALAPKEAQG